MAGATGAGTLGLLRRRTAAAALLASAPVNAVGVTALFAMYAGFALGERSAAMSLGRTNDILGLVGTVLMMPAVYEIHILTGPNGRSRRTLLSVVGIGAMAAIVWLQFLLVSERLTFEQQLPMVLIAYLAIAIWFIGSGRGASRAGVMPDGVKLGIAAALYVGQPWWAIRWARRLVGAAHPGARPVDLVDARMSIDPPMASR